MQTEIKKAAPLRGKAANENLQSISYRGIEPMSIQNLQELIGLLLFNLQIREEGKEALANWSMFGVLLSQYIEAKHQGELQ